MKTNNNFIKWLLGLFVLVAVIGAIIGILSWKDRQNQSGFRIVTEGKEISLVGKTVRKQMEIIQAKFLPEKNDQLYVIDFQISPPNDIFNKPASVFNFKNHTAIIDSSTGEYKIIKPQYSPIATGDDVINLTDWNIDATEALRIAKTKFDIYDSRYPNSDSSVKYYFLHQKIGEKPEWRIVYSTSEEYANQNRGALPLTVFIDAKTGDITFTRGL